MDAEEFLNTLMDRIEKQLKGTKQENLLNDYIYGSFCNELIAQKETDEGKMLRNTREENFITLPLEVKNNSSIQESLEEMIKGESLEGENA